MQFNQMKTAMVFAACGLCFGLLAMLISFLTLYPIWLWAGIFFFLALATGCIIVEAYKWFSLPRSTWRYLVLSLFIVGIYPMGFVVMFLSIIGYDSLYKALAPARWAERFRSGDYLVLWEAIPVGLVIAALVCGLFISAALKIVIRTLDKKMVLLMMLAGVITVPISAGLGKVIGMSNWLLILFPVSQMLFGGLIGYWLQRAASPVPNN